VSKQYGTTGPRGLYPDICDSRSLSRCSVLANALWPRIIVQADDQGRLHGDATDIRGICFPKMPRVTVKAVGEALAELIGVGSLLSYEAAGEPYLQIRDWWQYQSYQRRAFPSRHPSPDGWTDLVYGLEGRPGTYTQAAAAERGGAQRTAAGRSGTPPSLAKPSLAKPSPPQKAAGDNGAVKDRKGPTSVKEILGSFEDIVGTVAS